jgi:hypothetical protein
MATKTQLSAGDLFNPDQHVQPALMTGDLGYVTSETIVIAALNHNIETGLPVVDGNRYSPSNFTPIGVLENASVAQQKTIQQLWEIGSRKSYFVPGRTFIQVVLNRVLFDGPSLMRTLYPTIRMEEYTDSTFTNSADSPGIAGNTSVDRQSERKVDLWFNLASKFFNKPSTIALIFYDNDKNPIGNIVLEDAYAEALNLGITSGQTIVTENVRLRVGSIESIGTMNR